MKTWKHCTVFGIFAIIVFVFVFITCDNDNGKDITRKFTITGFAKDITVIDARTGSNDKDLEALGVIGRITAGLNSAKASGNSKFDPVINRGITIVVEETTAYDFFNVYSGNKLGVRLDYILSDDEYLSVKMEGFIANVMYNNNTLGKVIAQAKRKLNV